VLAQREMKFQIYPSKLPFIIILSAILIISLKLFIFVLLINQLWIGLKSVNFILKKNPIVWNYF
jgi:hypothetical protein